MRLFISAGEPSGDVHAANLIRSIRRLDPGVEVVGFGGPEMTEAGARLLYPLVDLAVMWFVRVIANLPTFFRVADLASAYFKDERPDAVILIDYPGFHWHIAKRARAAGIPVIYYVPPQIWAWGGWRVEKVKRSVDEVLCSLPFEPAWYESNGYGHATYVGHPFFDEERERAVDDRFIADQRADGRPIVAILPGSRTQEITRNLPIFLEAAGLLARSHPDARFLVSCLRPRHAAIASELVAAANLRGVDLTVLEGKTAEVIRSATIAWAVSGSVGLELMLQALPTVVLYKVRRFDLWVARWFIKSRYISLVNLLADAEVFPEYLTPIDVSDKVADWGDRWLSNPDERDEVARRLVALRDRVARPGAADQAAGRIVARVRATGRPGPIPPPHQAVSRATSPGRSPR